jgi:hypothetical protein
MVVLEISLRKIPNDYINKKHYLQQNSNEINTLILGSSHSLYGLDPVYFSANTFNASHISQTLNFDYEILKKYDHKFENLKAIVLPISYFTLYEVLQNTDEDWRVKNYIIYHELDNQYDLKYFSEVFSNKLSLNIARLVSFYLNDDSNIFVSNLGWGTKYKSEQSKNLKKSSLSAVKRHTINDFEYLADNILSLYGILEWSKNRSVQVVLFTPPAYIDYRNNLNEAQLSTLVETAEDIANKFDNCTYYNLINSKEFTFQDYYDGDHLNEIGAKKLSLLINDKIVD